MTVTVGEGSVGADHHWNVSDLLSQSPLRLLTQGYRLGHFCWQEANCLTSPLCFSWHWFFFLPHLPGLLGKLQWKMGEE